MFVNGVAVSITHSKNIGLIMAKDLLAWVARQIVKQLLKVCAIYQCVGFKIQTMLMETEFNIVQSEFLYAIINTMAANEHVGNIP